MLVTIYELTPHLMPHQHEHTYLLSILERDNHWVVPEDRLLHNNRLGGYHSHLSRSRLQTNQN